jgi:hypothetical protein
MGWVPVLTARHYTGPASIAGRRSTRDALRLNDKGGIEGGERSAARGSAMICGGAWHFGAACYRLAAGELVVVAV